MIALIVSYKLHNVLPLTHAYLLTYGGLAHIDGGVGLLGDDTDLLCRESRAEQTADLYLLIGKYVAVFSGKAGMEIVVKPVDDGGQVVPYEQAARRNLPATDGGDTFQQRLVMLGRRSGHHPDYAELLQKGLLEQSVLVCPVVFTDCWSPASDIRSPSR